MCLYLQLKPVHIESLIKKTNLCRLCTAEVRIPWAVPTLPLQAVALSPQGVGWRESGGATMLGRAEPSSQSTAMALWLSHCCRLTLSPPLCWGEAQSASGSPDLACSLGEWGSASSSRPPPWAAMLWLSPGTAPALGHSSLPPPPPLLSLPSREGEHKAHIYACM